MVETTDSSKKKRVAKNTLMLYIRMFLTVAISLYTSRIVLEQLGVNDYGIYNVVGGLVSMFSIVSSSMTSAIGRFLTFELGRGNIEKLKLIFSNAVTIQIIMGVLIALLIETIGVWFLNSRMNISAERMYAANWVLQFSMVTFIINMISVPFNSVLISHERMGAFAYITVLEVILKLGVAFLLFIKYFDSLIWYSFLIMMIAVVIRIVYGIYCKRHFEECTTRLRIDKNIFKSMFSYSGWNFIGSSSAVLKDQGINILLNLFCGSAINAARGLAAQVNVAVYSFSSNFMVAMNPQIIKSYAAGDKDYLYSLIIQGARISIYLLMLLSVPVIIEAPALLNLWLVNVPDYAISFTRLVLLVSIFDSLSIPLLYANQATGQIRTYQLVVGGIQLLNIPIAYIFLSLGSSPNIVYIITLILSIVGLFARLIILKSQIDLPVGRFVKRVLINAMLIFFLAISLPTLLYMVLPLTWVSFIIVVVVSLAWTSAVCFTIGCDKSEKERVKGIINSLISKIFKHA